MTYRALTKEQLRLLDFSYDFLSENGCSPSIEEICAGTGLSANNLSAKLRALCFRGLIHLERHHAGRSLAIAAVEHPVKGIACAEETIFIPELGAWFFEGDAETLDPITVRKCLCCQGPFEARSPFLRLCPRCRDEATQEISVSIDDAYRSNAEAISIGVPGFGLGGFKKASAA